MASNNKAEFAVELEDDVTPAAKRASTSLGRLQAQFQKFNNSAAGRATQKFASVAKDIMAIGVAVAAGVGAGITSMTVGMVDFNQRSTLAFKALAKDGEDSGKSLQNIVDLTKEFGLDLKETTAAAIRLKSAGFSQNETENLVKMGADMRVLGASSEQLGRAFLAIEQIKSAGTLQGDELNQLADAGVPKAAVFEELAKAMGKTVPEILKLKEAGKIGADQTIDAIGKAMLRLTGGKEFGEVGRKVANETLGGMAGKLKAGFQDLFRRVALDSESPIAKAFGPIADRLFKLFEDPSTQAALSQAITSIANAIEKAIPFIEIFIESVGEGFMKAWPDIKGALVGMMDLFGEISGSGSTAETIAKIGKAIGEIAAVLVGAFLVAVGLVSAAIVGLTAVWNFWKDVLGTFVDSLGAVVFAVVDFFANISAIFDNNNLSIGEKALALGRAIINGVVNGMKALAMLPINTLKSMAQGWVNAVSSVLQMGSPSKVFEELGMFTAQGFNLGVEGEMPTVQGVTSMLGSATAAPMAAGGNTQNVSVNLNVTAGPGATAEDAQRLGTELGPIIRREILAVLDEGAIEMGIGAEAA